MSLSNALYLICFFYWVCGTFGYIDLYLPEDQVYKLFGIVNSQLYYVRNGKVNINAVGFIAHVQPDHTTLTYIWHTTNENDNVHYDMKLYEINECSSDCIADNYENVMDARTIKRNESGKVPYIPDVLKINVTCNGMVSNTLIVMELTFHSSRADDQKIMLKRLKSCVGALSVTEKKPTEKPVVTPPTYPHDEDLDDSVYASDSSQRSTKAFFISVSLFSVLIFVIVVSVSVWHVRVSRYHNVSGSVAYHRRGPGESQISNQFLRPDLPNNITRRRSHSSLTQLVPLINDLGTGVAELRTKLAEICISRKDVSSWELILKGTFARIYRGSLPCGTHIYIKSVSDEATTEQKRLLLLEGSLLRGMNHHNLLPVKHAVLDTFDSEPPMVIFQFMEGGNLKHYLQGVKLNEGPGLLSGMGLQHLGEHITTQDLVEMAIQIACGMVYLSKYGIVHKDLATRNCVVGSNRRVKVTDNALSRDIFPADYCCLCDNENRPVRWLALESLIHKVYSSGSDVWAFGVLLWELESLAAMPYTDIDDFEMADYLCEGYRLSQPISCPDHLYSIMADCWHYSPDRRPTFTNLLQMLTKFSAELGDYI